MKFKSLLLLAFSALLVVSACKKTPVDPDPDPDPIPGCMDENSLNYNADATEDDGSCEYADVILPLKVGNTWTLQDDITIPLIGSVTVNMVFTVEKDTVIGEYTYQIMGQEIGVDGFDPQTIRTAYRFEPTTGRTYSLQIDTAGREEALFLDYPLDLGATWNSAPPENDSIISTVVGIGLETVPAGSFTDVYEINFFQTSAEVEVKIFFSKDVGYVKADFYQEVFGYEIWARPELISYSLVD